MNYLCTLVPGRVRARAGCAIIAAVTIVGVIAGCASSSSSSASSSASSSVADASLSADQALVSLLPAAIKSSGVLSFGALWETPPAISVEPGNATVAVGIAPDLSQAIGKLLGLTVTWKNMQWPAQLPGVQSGVVDALMGQVSDTAQREKSVVDLVPWDHYTTSLLLPAGNPKKISSLATACGDKIGVPIGSVNSDEVAAASKACTQAGKPAITAIGYTNASGPLTAIRAGNIDGWVSDTPSLKSVVDSAPTVFTQVVLPNSEVQPYDDGLLGIAVSKSNPGLSQALLGALKVLIADGVYQEILAKWKSADVAVPAKYLDVNPLTKTTPGTKA